MALIHQQKKKKATRIKLIISLIAHSISHFHFVEDEPQGHAGILFFEARPCGDELLGHAGILFFEARPCGTNCWGMPVFYFLRQDPAGTNRRGMPVFYFF